MQSENKTYSAADIERYHAGQMPAQEMHALEKAALDDPFLADALEGYPHTATPAADLQAIRERLFGKEERKKRFLVPQWLKIAAILVIMAVGTWLTYSLIQTDNNSLAIQKEKPVEATEVPQLNRTITATDSINNETDLASTGLTEENQDALNDVEKPEVKTKRTARAPVLASGKTNRQQPANIHQTEPVSEPAPIQLSAIARDTDSILQGRVGSNNRDISRKEMATARVIESRNQDQRNRAMPNLENNNQVRNQDGYYRNTQNDTITVNAYGTQRRTVIDDSTKHINVVMQPANNQIAEVVVLGNSDKSKEGKMRRVVIDSLEPAEGWANFDDYIASNLKEPEEIKVKKLPGGEVELSFDVNRRGEPVNIAVVKSLCTTCDEEAIRLLKEGPKWKKNKNSKGRLTIRF